MPKYECRCGFTIDLVASPSQREFLLVRELAVEAAGDFAEPGNASRQGLFSVLDEKALTAYRIYSEPAYIDRWTLLQLNGARSFQATHTDCCLTQGFGGIIANQVALNTGFNTAGDLASWEEILPATNGTFSVQCTRWMRAYLSEPQSLKSGAVEWPGEIDNHCKVSGVPSD